MVQPVRPAPTDPPRDVVRIVPVPLAGPLVVLFAAALQGLLVHRHQSRPHACPGEASCPPVIHRSRTLWYGYAPVYVWRTGRDDWHAGVLEVTEALEEVLRGRQLRGELWMLERSAARRKTGPVSGVLLEQRGDVATPAPFDIRAPLQRLYHTTDLALGAENPLPRKLVMAAVKLAPPPGPEAFGLAEAPRPRESQAEALRRIAPQGLGRLHRQKAGETNGEK